MTDRKPKNVAASVRQRLLNIAKASDRPFQETLQYFAMERFLYRLTQTPHASKFILKGALMLTVWRASTIRPTKDIDLLGNMSNRVDDLMSVFRDACHQAVESDGLDFDPDSIAGVVIKEDADYEGVRITFRGSLQNIPISMQVDVGFGDIVFPGASMTEYPTILDHTAPRLRAYTRETTVAEKFEAMAKLGLSNSRMKDFYDIWLLSSLFDFNGEALALAVEKTFANRGTTVTAQPTALSPSFATDETKVTQWQAFVRKSRLNDAPADLSVAIESIATFLRPVAQAVESGEPFVAHWNAPGPWVVGSQRPK